MANSFLPPCSPAFVLEPVKRDLRIFKLELDLLALVEDNAVVILADHFVYVGLLAALALGPALL